MDNGSHNFQETPQNEQQPQRAPKSLRIAAGSRLRLLLLWQPDRWRCWRRDCLFGNQPQSKSRCNRYVRKAGTTKISNVSVNESSASEQALRRLKALSFPL